MQYRDLDDPQNDKKVVDKNSSKDKLLIRPMRFILDYSDII